MTQGIEPPFNCGCACHVKGWAHRQGFCCPTAVVQHNHTLMDPGPMRDCPGCDFIAWRRGQE